MRQGPFESCFNSQYRPRPQEPYSAPKVSTCPHTNLVNDFEVLQLAAWVNLLIHAHVVPVTGVGTAIVSARLPDVAVLARQPQLVASSLRLGTSWDRGVRRIPRVRLCLGPPAVGIA